MSRVRPFIVAIDGPAGAGKSTAAKRLAAALGFALGSFAMLTFMGLGVGLAQWLLLRRELNKTGWWPVMNAVAWPPCPRVSTIR